jgi:hypothetical protein
LLAYVEFFTSLTQRIIRVGGATNTIAPSVGKDRGL